MSKTVIEHVLSRLRDTGIKDVFGVAGDFAFPINDARERSPCAFDLLELDGRDLRREPIEKRKALLAKLLKGSHLSIALNEHFEEDGASVYSAACQLGCEGIVSKRLGSPYRPGRSSVSMSELRRELPSCKGRSAAGTDD